jgi:hypothetical protein
MVTSIVLVALATSPALTGRVSETTPVWQSDYFAAQRLSGQEKKPLAVFLGRGPRGWDSLSKEGQLSREAQELLNAHYICVYVDHGQASNKKLAEAFRMTEGTGVVLSDRTGDVQSFRHQGKLTNKELEGYLRTHADANRVVQRTETHVREDVRYYYPPSQPSSFQMGGFSGGC